MVRRKMNLVNEIMEYESKGLKPKREKKLFQHLVDTGMAWKLQGFYGRRASDLLKTGIIKQKKK